MIPTLLLGRDCCRGRRHRRHGHNVFGPRRRRQGHLERRERVALHTQEEASVAAERVDEGRLGVRRRDLGRNTILAASACKQDATEPCETFSIKVVAGWEGCDPDMAFTEPCETAEQFNVITNTAIADGVITDA